MTKGEFADRIAGSFESKKAASDAVDAVLDDPDIRSLFAYLQSLAPVHNRVPAPIDPPEPGQ